LTGAGSDGSNDGTVPYIKIALITLYVAAKILLAAAIDGACTFVAVAVVTAPFLWLAGVTDVRGVAITIGCVGGGLIAVAQTARHTLAYIEAVRAALTKARLARLDALMDEP